MERKLQELYDRIKDYDVESLGVDLLFQLERKVDGKDIHPRIRSFRQGFLSNARFIQRACSKKVTLEKAMETCPQKVESLVKYIGEAIVLYGCTV